MTARTTRRLFPQLDTESFQYCAVFYEAGHNDARTNVAIALSAAQHGAHIANYVEVVDLLRDASSAKVVGAVVTDRMTGATFNIRAKKVLFAGGPFTDGLREMETAPDASKETTPAVKGSWGTHIVLPGYYLPKGMGLLDANTSDGRFMFIVPWQGHTLVGTTDVLGPAETSPEAPEDDVAWLLNECSKYLSPQIKPCISDVSSAWRGWRPLAADPHAPPNAPVSRDHVISENPQSGVIFIAGGKWTTWREMAQEAIDRAALQSDHAGPCRTLDIVLHGGDGYSDRLSFELLHMYPQLTPDVAEHLVRTYGGLARKVCQIAHQNDMNGQLMLGKKKAGHVGGGFDRLVPNFPYIEAEVVYACREYACTVEDVLSRRTRLAFLDFHAAELALDRVTQIMSHEWGWSKSVAAKQREAARKYIQAYRPKLLPPTEEADNDESAAAVA
jgi:glycerol-3-phosphate dehydrogenase